MTDEAGNNAGEASPEAKLLEKIRGTVKELSANSPNIHQLASFQLQMQTDYYDLVSKQANRNLKQAYRFSYIGLVFFAISILLLILQPYFLSYFFINYDAEKIKTIVAVSNASFNSIVTVIVIVGILFELIALTIFYFYGRKLNQLDTLQMQADTNQRFLLANSVCQSIIGDKKAGQLIIIKSLVEYEPEKQEKPKNLKIAFEAEGKSAE